MLWFVTKVCLKICQWEYVFYVLALNPIFWALLLRRASVNYMYDGLLATNLSYQCWLPLEIVEGLYRDRDLKFRRPNWTNMLEGEGGLVGVGDPGRTGRRTKKVTRPFFEGEQKRRIVELDAANGERLTHTPSLFHSSSETATSKLFGTKRISVLWCPILGTWPWTFWSEKIVSVGFEGAARPWLSSFCAQVRACACVRACMPVSVRVFAVLYNNWVIYPHYFVTIFEKLEFVKNEENN